MICLLSIQTLFNSGMACAGLRFHRLVCYPMRRAADSKWAGFAMFCCTADHPLRFVAYDIERYILYGLVPSGKGLLIDSRLYRVLVHPDHLRGTGKRRKVWKLSDKNGLCFRPDSGNQHLEAVVRAFRVGATYQCLH